MRVALASLAVVAAILMTSYTEAANKKVVCYYTNWSAYRKGAGKYEPHHVQANLCTHVIYSFMIARSNQVVIHDSWLDVEKKYLQQIADLRKSNPNLKVMMAVGGWNNGGGPFSQMARSAATRKTFIDSALALINKYNFDGFDLDWEYPGQRGGDPGADKNNFSQLIREFQAAFKNNRQRRLLLSAAVGPAGKTANTAYDKGTICRELDFVNLMNYDIHGGWEKTTGFNAPLRTASGEMTPENVLDTMVKEWIQAGCARDKLIFGIPMYGRGWRTSSQQIGGSGPGPSTRGKYTGEAGIMSYYEICEKLSSGWQEKYDIKAEEAIAYGEGQLVTYDNVRSINAKVDYIKEMQLGGAMIWALDFDDFSGQFCRQGKYPLLTAINKRLMGASSGMRVTVPQPPPETRPQPARTTADPNCSPWWCPSKTKATQRPTWRAVTRRTTSYPVVAPTRPPTGGCLPTCDSSNNGKFMVDQCNPNKFYQCHLGTRYSFNCGAGLVFKESCACCDWKK